MKQPQACSTALYKGIVKALRNGALVATLALSASTAVLAQTAEQRAFDIPEQPLPAALKAFAEQAGMQLLYRPETIDGAAMRSLKGQLDKHQALQHLLEGTDLEAVYSADDAATIRPRGKALSTSGNAGSAAIATATAADASVQASDRTHDANPYAAPQTASESGRRTQELQTVTVTGTRIRGGETPSPVITIGSERIREEGFTDLGQVIRSVPQNFAGGQNPGVTSGDASAVNIYNQNITGGSGLNLRGLGPDASLTLINGRRLAYDGYAQAVDISTIPVEAVERLDVVLDGASAIYGSDAVAGVANVILKRDFEGVMVGARYGGATDGGLTTRELTFTTGATWSTGGLITSFRYASNEPIYARQRNYTHALYWPRSIYPELESKSGLVSVHQSLGDAVELRLDVLHNRLASTSHFGFVDYYAWSEPETETTLASPSVEFQLPRDWSVVLGATYGNAKSIFSQSTVRSTGTTMIRGCYCNDSYSYDIGAEGPLLAMPGGDMRLAIGAGSRTNEFWNRRYTSPILFGGEESVNYGYAEINFPLVSPAMNISGMRRLEFNAAVRREDNENFGGVTTPKVGFIYAPSDNFTWKASWSRSFKAPTLEQRYQRRFSYLWNASQVGGIGYAPDATALMSYGGSDDLEAERARTWTASLAFHPEAIPGLLAELTYFDVDYTDRVVQPLGNYYQAMSNPFVAEFVHYSPTAEEQAAVLATYTSFSNLAGSPYDPSKVVAILRGENVNAARQRIKGLDLSGSYSLSFADGRLTVRGSASWLDSSQQTSAGQNFHPLAGRIFNPAEYRGRFGTVWTRGGFSASSFVSYTSGVTSALTTMTEKTASFTAVDATMRYDMGERGMLSDLAFELSAQNLFNRQPPLYTPAANNAAPYDSTNYSAIGRFLSVSVSKRW